MHRTPFALLVVAVMAVIFLVDLWLGPRAEYLNAHAIVGELGRLVLGVPPTRTLPLFTGSGRLAPALRLPVGLLLWTGEAVLISTLLALPLSIFHR